MSDLGLLKKETNGREYASEPIYLSISSAKKELEQILKEEKVRISIDDNLWNYLIINGDLEEKLTLLKGGYMQHEITRRSLEYLAEHHEIIKERKKEAIEESSIEHQFKYDDKRIRTNDKSRRYDDEYLKEKIMAYQKVLNKLREFSSEEKYFLMMIELNKYETMFWDYKMRGGEAPENIKKIYDLIIEEKKRSSELIKDMILVVNKNNRLFNKIDFYDIIRIISTIIRKYDPKKNNSPSSYLLYSLKKRLNLKGEEHLIKIPQQVRTVNSIVEKQEEEYNNNGERYDKEELMKKEMDERGMIKTDTGQVILAGDMKLFSITDENGEEIVKSEDQNPLRIAIENEMEWFIKKKIEELDPREKEIIIRRFYENKTLEEIGEELGGITRERVRQIEKRALNKLMKKIPRKL